jgi:hypothetical protein
MTLPTKDPSGVPHGGHAFFGTQVGDDIAARICRNPRESSFLLDILVTHDYLPARASWASAIVAVMMARAEWISYPGLRAHWTDAHRHRNCRLTNRMQNVTAELASHTGIFSKDGAAFLSGTGVCQVPRVPSLKAIGAEPRREP